MMGSSNHHPTHMLLRPWQGSFPLVDTQGDQNTMLKWQRRSLKGRMWTKIMPSVNLILVRIKDQSCSEKSSMGQIKRTGCTSLLRRLRTTHVSYSLRISSTVAPRIRKRMVASLTPQDRTEANLASQKEDKRKWKLIPIAQKKRTQERLPDYQFSHHVWMVKASLLEITSLTGSIGWSVWTKLALMVSWPMRWALERLFKPFLWWRTWESSERSMAITWLSCQSPLLEIGWLSSRGGFPSAE